MQLGDLRPSPRPFHCSPSRAILWLCFSISLLYNLYILNLLDYSITPNNIKHFNKPYILSIEEHKKAENTSLHHLVFGIAGSSHTWSERRKCIQLWWRPDEMRGAVWLDQIVKNGTNDHLLPPIKISSNTSPFKYENPIGHRSALRLTRIVSETLKLGMKDVRWFVMGDDDTLFFPDNLVKVLSKYDHNQYPRCDWKMADPLPIARVEVLKRPDPYVWDRAPRRNCCRILPTEKNDTLVVDVGECGEDESIEVK
ncbi:hypothetical protein NC652_029983 [Populus alba x Populus x berolinensis]|nr:hypothetical protein NC652_029983 [Populus alba x Populus x berolinensis]